MQHLLQRLPQPVRPVLSLHRHCSETPALRPDVVKCCTGQTATSISRFQASPAAPSGASVQAGQTHALPAPGLAVPHTASACHQGLKLGVSAEAWRTCCHALQPSLRWGIARAAETTSELHRSSGMTPPCGRWLLTAAARACSQDTSFDAQMWHQPEPDQAELCCDTPIQ